MLFEMFNVTTILRYNAPGITSDRAHLLSTVISNLQMDGNYYTKAVLPFVLNESSNMFKAFEVR